MNAVVCPAGSRDRHAHALTRSKVFFGGCFGVLDLNATPCIGAQLGQRAVSSARAATSPCIPGLVSNRREGGPRVGPSDNASSTLEIFQHAVHPPPRSLSFFLSLSLRPYSLRSTAADCPPSLSLSAITR